MICTRQSETNYRRAVGTIRALIREGKDIQATCEAEKLIKYVDIEQVIADCSLGLNSEEAKNFSQLLTTMIMA